MTIQETKKLTPEEKRIRIAEICGWKQEKSPHGDWNIWIAPNGVYHGLTFPDYLNDLNAMHPVEIAMFKDTASDRWALYTANLCNVVDMDSIISATAAQRADAFLLTVGVPMGQKTLLSRDRRS